MKNNHLIIAAIILAAGLIGMGIAISHGTVKFKKMDNCVSVRGLAEMEVSADKVIWPISFEETGDDINVLYAALDRKGNSVKTFLKDGGIADEEITMTAPIATDNWADIYSGDKAKFRYKVNSIITVVSTDVTKVRKIMAKQRDLANSGVVITSSDNQTEFMFTKLNDVKPKMIEEATKNARDAAKKFAEDSHSRLGKIKTAQQGQFSISDRDSNTPYIKNVRVVSTVVYFLKN